MMAKFVCPPCRCLVSAVGSQSQSHNQVQKSQGGEFDPHTGHIFDNLYVFLDKIESLSFHRSQQILSVLFFFFISNIGKKKYILIIMINLTHFFEPTCCCSVAALESQLLPTRMPLLIRLRYVLYLVKISSADGKQNWILLWITLF